MILINGEWVKIEKNNFHENLFNKHKIKPESLSKIEISKKVHIIENIRYIFKQADYLLACDGVIVLNVVKNTCHGCGIRSIQQIMCAFQLCTAGRYELVENRIEQVSPQLIFKKKKRYIEKYENTKNITFGILTTDKGDVRALVKDIVEQGIKNYEIIIISNNKKHTAELLNGNNDVHIEEVLDIDGRPQISHKKNLLIKKSKYEYICLMHDRYRLSPSWYEKYKRYQGYFDIMSFKNIGPNGGRVSDYNCWSSDVDDRWRFDFALPKYNDYQKYWYSQGGIFVLNKKNNYSLPDVLNWNELEDVVFSKVIKEMGAYYTFDLDNIVYTNKNRLPETRSGDYLLNNIKGIVKFWLSVIKNGIRYHIR